VPVSFVAQWWLRRDEIRARSRRSSTSKETSQGTEITTGNVKQSDKIQMDTEHKKVPTQDNTPVLSDCAREKEGKHDDQATTMQQIAAENYQESSPLAGGSGGRVEEIPGPSLRRSRSSSLEAAAATSSGGGGSSSAGTQQSPAVIPLDVKSAALERVLAGEMQAAVARDLNIRPSTLAHWWSKRDKILALVRQAAAGTGAVSGEQQAATDVTVESASEPVRKLVSTKDEQRESVVETDAHTTTTSAINTDEMLSCGDGRTQPEGAAGAPTTVGMSESDPATTNHRTRRQAGLGRRNKEPSSSPPGELEKGDDFPDQTVQELENTFVEALPTIDTVLAAQMKEKAPESDQTVGSFPVGTLSVKPIGLPGVKQELLKSMKSAFAGKGVPVLPESAAGPKKKKSLEFLANGLLERALAQLAGRENVILASTENCPTDGKTVRDKTEDSACNSLNSGSAATVTPSVGLSMIADSYVSSEEDES